MVLDRCLMNERMSIDVMDRWDQEIDAFENELLNLIGIYWSKPLISFDCARSQWFISWIFNESIRSTSTKWIEKHRQTIYLLYLLMLILNLDLKTQSDDESLQYIRGKSEIQWKNGIFFVFELILFENLTPGK
jgi:hypothetical protein